VKRILVVCPGSWDEAALSRPEIAGRYQILRAATAVWDMPWYRLLLTHPADFAREIARRHAGADKVDGVVGTGDYPGALLAAAIAAELGLPGPPFAQVVRLSHKVLSREIHRRWAPEATPDFAALDPGRPHEPPRLAYPFFVKPVKGTMSIGARLVRSRAELAAALRFGWRERLSKRILLTPFARMLRSIGEDRVPAHWFIAEEPLEGVQVTVDGFVANREATVMGVVDSVMYPGTQSFRRFEYPSRLPVAVQERMGGIAMQIMTGSGFDHSCFNIEMFWDAARDRLSVIEVNPRMSYQFADLHEWVDGVNTYDLQLRLATSEPHGFRRDTGRHGAATSFVMRRFRDARVRAVPGPEAVAELGRRHPGSRVMILCGVGDRLSDHDQDVGSYRYAIVNMSAPTREALELAWREAETLLRFEFED